LITTHPSQEPPKLAAIEGKPIPDRQVIEEERSLIQRYSVGGATEFL
jgi:hypothetical protein